LYFQKFSFVVVFNGFLHIFCQYNSICVVYDAIATGGGHGLIKNRDVCPLFV